MSDFESAGDVLKGMKLPVAARRPRKGLKPGGPASMRLIETASHIAQGDEMKRIYSHTAFCQIGLPYRKLDPAERIWERKNGNVLMQITAGQAYNAQLDRFVDVEMPWGPKVRLVQIYLDSMAVQTQNRRIETDRSLTSFVTEKLKLPNNGRTITSVKAALGQFAAATWRFGVSHDGRAITINSQIIEQFEIWMPKDERQRVLFPEFVEYSQKYFENLMDHAVPLLDEAVAGLSHNAMALDIYRWLAQRLHRQNPDRPMMLTWNVLHEQFGWNYGRLDNFRPVFLRTLAEVLAVYPQARGRVYADEANEVCRDGRGLWLCHAAPPVVKIQTTVPRLPAGR